MSTASITLRQISGRPAGPARLSESVLVIVDAQNTYRSGIMQLTGVEPALDECARLLARARALKIPVIHVQHDAGPGTPYDVRAGIGAIADEVAPAAGEPVVVKHYPNSFVGTDLDARLKATGVQNLVVAGFMTHMCINSTARGAFNLGYGVTVPAAATATRPLPAPDDGVISAAALQSAALAALGDLFAVVVPDGAAIPD
ncbi:cysteine hydrolase family protein [Pseudothauera rhizosphaerae]|uniref:Cysteine hydrolase n=1 Tax=Pseudothauera rhizosphaerae TaxID=2565932 RepID=A0A4S4ACU8_9RHOO|nr:cysteine hydrolase family protein [Pseudothauera rhizosphaerae]THF56528.1 cysteine hydrolase [Pseudothauera rhizosphaerae]